MTRKSIYTLIVTLSLVTAFAVAPAADAAGLNTGAGPWQWVYPLVQGTAINDVSFIDDNTGWAVGQGGVIMKTTDGGDSWTAQNSGTTYNILGVDFVNGTTGWAVGNLGDYTSFVIKTVDGGTTWTAQTLPGSYSTASLEDVDFTSSTHGVAVGNGKIYYTSTGGSTWVAATGIGDGHYLLRVQLVDGNNGFAVGQTGVVYKTVNGGVSWTQKTITGVTSDLKGLYFKDANNGFVVGSSGTAGRILRTGDGGDTWAANTIPSVISRPLTDIAVSTDNITMLAPANDGTIYRLQSGSLWSDPIDTIATQLQAAPVASGAASQLTDVQFTSVGVAFVGGFAGVVAKGTSAASTWQVKAGGDAYNLTAVSFVDADTGFAGGAGGRVVKTADGGDTWSLDATGLPADFQIYDLDFVDGTYGVAVGCQGASCPSSGTATAYRYNSGTWTAMGGTSGTSLNDVSMATTTSGWAVGADGTAFQTSNGTSWTADNTGIASNYELNGVDTIDPANNAWAVGNNTSTHMAVYATYSGGSWTVSDDFPSVGFFVDVDMVDASTGYLVGSGGSLYKTTNGGGVWTAQSSGTSKLLAGVSFLDANYGFAVGEDGRLIHTTDGGANWGAENLGTNISFFDVSTVGERQAFAVGGNGSIMKSLRSYYYTWYDDKNSNNWILMANPSSGGGDLWFDQFIGGVQRSLENSGQVTPGNSLTPKYAGVIGGPVNTSSLTAAKAIVSQRTLWPKGGSSIEEVLGMDIDRLSNHYYWTWYDQQSAGYTNWVLVANPNPFTVYYQIKVAGVLRNQGTVAAGKNVTPTLAGVIGGPVEVLAWNDNYNGNNKADVFASQRVLSNYGGAFNEQIGTPAEELSSHYLWTWYDDRGGANWILIANPSGAAMDYDIRIAGQLVETSRPGQGLTPKAAIPPGGKVTPRFGITGGPVDVQTFAAVDHVTQVNSISSQRVIWGTSFAETPGYPFSALSSTYHWTWYDNKAAGMKNWVLVANPSPTDTVEFDVLIKGVSQSLPDNDNTLAPGERLTPTFVGQQDGPVEVRAWVQGGSWSNPSDRRDVMASQRVLYNNYFNEVLGTVLD